MKRTLLVAALLIASTTAASAGVYGGLSVGPDGAVQDDTFDLTSGGRAVRLLGGYRLGRLAAEASITGNMLREEPSGREVDHRQVALLGKYNFPIGANFELFGRAGIQYTSLTRADADHFTGKGVILGPGVEYVLRFVAASATIRLDYTISYAEVESPTFSAADSVSFTSGQWMLGFTIGM